MIKHGLSFLFAVALAANASAQVTLESWNDFRSARNNMAGTVPVFFQSLSDCRAAAVAPPAAAVRDLHTYLTAMGSLAGKLKSADVPQQLRPDVIAAADAISGKLPSPAVLTNLDTLAQSSAKWAPVVEKKQVEMDSRLEALKQLAEEVRDIQVLAGQRVGPITDLLQQMPASPAGTDKCVVEQIDKSGAALASSLKYLKSALDRIQADLAVDGRTQSGLATLKSEFGNLDGIRLAVHPLVDAATRLDSLFGEKVDLSFRYWGRTPGGSFGEVQVPLVVSSATLLSGGEAVASHVKATLPAALQPLAETYGMGYAVQAVDDDLRNVMASVTRDLNALSTATMAGVGDLSSTLSQINAAMPVLATIVEKELPKADKNAADFGVLETPPGFDYRDIRTNLDGLTPQKLADRCRGN